MSEAAGGRGAAEVGGRPLGLRCRDTSVLTKPEPLTAPPQPLSPDSHRISGPASPRRPLSTAATMSKVPPAYTDIGKKAKDVLGGYQYGWKATAAPSLDFLDAKVTMTQKGGDVEHEVKATVSAFAKTFAKAEVTLNHKADLNISLTRDRDVEGLKLVLAGNPVDASSLKGTVEYGNGLVNSKFVSALTATPKLDITASTKLSEVLVGGTATFDTASAKLSKYALGAGWAHKDHTVSVFAEDQLATVRALVSSQVRNVAVAAELKYKLSGGGLEAATGAQWNSGALKMKAKVSTKGVLELATESKLGPHTATACGQFNALKGGDAKLGVSIDFKP